MRNTLRASVPNVITFVGLACAFSAVLSALHEELVISGILILIGYLLDALDGAAARRLGVASPFGLQLDSLVDVVTFGVAPAVLAYQHLRQMTLSPAILWIVCGTYLIGGVFRLARFNLLPAKQSHSDSVGLTISTSGATLALSVLADCAYDGRLIPAGVFLALMAGLTLLMVSRIRYPALPFLFRRCWLSVIVLGTCAILSIWLSPQLVGFGLTGGYVSFGLIRALYQLLSA